MRFFIMNRREAHLMKNKSVGRVILNTIKEKWLLTAGIVITVVDAIET